MSRWAPGTRPSPGTCRRASLRWSQLSVLLGRVSFLKVPFCYAGFKGKPKGTPKPFWGPPSTRLLSFEGIWATRAPSYQGTGTDSPNSHGDKLLVDREGLLCAALPQVSSEGERNLSRCEAWVLSLRIQWTFSNRDILAAADFGVKVQNVKDQLMLDQKVKDRVGKLHLAINRSIDQSINR